MIIRRSVVAGHLVLLAVLSAFFVSGAALNDLGLNYSTDATSAGLKLHPYTAFTLLAVALMISGKQSLARCLRSRQFRVSMTGAGVTLAILVAKSLLGDAQSLGFAVDTLVAAFLIAAILPLMPPKLTPRLSSAALCFLSVECILAMTEAATQFNVIPIDTWYGAYFRATALQGHPLNNALIVVTVASALQSYCSRWTSLAIFGMTFGALIAFGARGALGLYVLANAIAFIRFGLRSPSKFLLLLGGGAIALVGLSWVLLSGLFGDRIVQVGAFDDSSEVRVQSLQILLDLNWTQLLFGSGSQQIARLMTEAKVGVIENFFVGYLLMFGGVLTVIIFFVVFSTCTALLAGVRGSDMRRMVVVLLVFLGTALTNNSLITKTPVLYLLVVGLWCASSTLQRRTSECRDTAASLTPPALGSDALASR